jgi:hypothetical protein
MKMAAIQHHLNLLKDSFATVDALDKCDILHLGKNSTTRADLAMFAVALGIHKGEKASNIGVAAFVREEYFTLKMMTQIVAISVNEDIKQKASDFDSCCNQGEVMALCSQYANTGFVEIQHLIDETPNTKVGKEALVWSLLDDLDELYNELFPDNTISFD